MLYIVYFANKCSKWDKAVKNTSTNHIHRLHKSKLQIAFQKSELIKRQSPANWSTNQVRHIIQLSTHSNWWKIADFNLKGFPYSLLSVGPAADPSVQAVSWQVNIVNLSNLYLTSLFEVTLLEFRRYVWRLKSWVLRRCLCDLCLAVLREHWLVTDRQTDRQTDTWRQHIS